MTPQEAIRAQIKRNTDILAVIGKGGLSAVGVNLSRQGQKYKRDELTEINSGLQKALEILGPDG